MTGEALPLHDCKVGCCVILVEAGLFYSCAWRVWNSA